MAGFITCSPGILGGKPCIKGTRISVEHILELVAGGASIDDIVDAYPHLNREKVSAALSYAAKAMRNEVMWETEISA